MVHANPGRKQRTKPAGTQPFCPTVPPNPEEKPLAPFATPHPRACPPAMWFLRYAARGIGSARSASDHGEVRLFTRCAWGDRPNWTDQAGLDRGGGRGGASAASLFAEFARPPSHCFRTRHCPRRSTLDQHFVGCPGATKHGGRKRVGTGMLLLYGSYMYVRSPTAVVPPSKV